MDNQRKLEILEEAFEMDAGTLKPEDRLEDLDQWDSMAKLSLIVVIDEECGKKLSGAQIKEFVTVKDILDYMG